MSEPYLGEIRMFGGNFAPSGWALCNGQLLSISEYSELFTLLGTTYGGDGQVTFALPDLQGRVPIHSGTAYPLGAKGGSETVTLTSTQLPAHTHTAMASTASGTADSPANAVWASRTLRTYSSGTTTVGMNPQAIAPVGGSQPHDNMMPSTVISFIISLYGIFPPNN